MYLKAEIYKIVYCKYIKYIVLCCFLMYISFQFDSGLHLVSVGYIDFFVGIGLIFGFVLFADDPLIIENTIRCSECEKFA